MDLLLKTFFFSFLSSSESDDLHRVGSCERAGKVVVNFFFFLWALLYLSISLNQLISFTHLTLIARYRDHHGRTRVLLSWQLAVTLVALPP